MNKVMAALSVFFLLTPLSSLMACPMCAGSTTADKNQLTAWILVVFIVLVYIPFVVIFRCIKKYSHLSQRPVENRDGLT
jgi:hypothetical protein